MEDKQAREKGIAQRAGWVAEAEHSNSMEGIATPQSVQADAQKYIAGLITSRELVEKARARYGIS